MKCLLEIAVWGALLLFGFLALITFKPETWDLVWILLLAQP